MLTPNPVQSTYAQYLTVAQVGMPASTSGWDIDTRIVEDASGNGIGFGLVVSQSFVTARGVVIGTLSGFAVVGITAADITLPNLDSGSSGQAFTDKYQDKDNAAVLVKGDIWVNAKTTVLAGGLVYYNTATGELGASSITNAAQLHGARWMTSVTTSGLAVVRITALGAN